MPVELSQQDCEQVRAAISLDLTADNLPDDVIMMPQFKQVAEAYVNSKLNTTPEPDEVLAKVALVKWTASLIVTKVPVVTSERVPAGTITIQAWDPIVKAAELKNEALDMIALANADETTPEPLELKVPFSFTSVGAPQRD